MITKWWRAYLHGVQIMKQPSASKNYNLIRIKIKVCKSCQNSNSFKKQTN